MPRTVKRMGEVLALFSTDRATLTLADVARDMQMSRSAANQLLTSMADVCVLERQLPGRYGLGSSLVQLRDALVSASPLILSAFPVLTDINSRLGESVELVANENGIARVVDCVSGTLPVSIQLPEVGSVREWHCTASGKIVRAWRNVHPASFRGVHLEARTSRTVTAVPQLAKEFATIRSRGFAFDQGEFLEDVYCFACPIEGERGQLHGTLGVSVPAHRFASTIRIAQPLLAGGARAISRLLRR